MMLIIITDIIIKEMIMIMMSLMKIMSIEMMMMMMTSYEWYKIGDPIMQQQQLEMLCLRMFYILFLECSTLKIHST